MSFSPSLLRDLVALRESLESVLEGTSGPGVEAANEPRVDVVETPEEVLVMMDLPGVAPDSLRLRLDGNLLVISGEVPAEQVGSEEVVMMERLTGRFTRTIRLPFSAVGAEPTAELERGVLTIKLKKKGARRVEVIQGP